MPSTDKVSTDIQAPAFCWQNHDMAAAAMQPRGLTVEPSEDLTGEFNAVPEQDVTTYKLFVPIPPIALRAMIGSGPEEIEPFELGKKLGSMIVVKNLERWKVLKDRFTAKPVMD